MKRFVLFQSAQRWPDAALVSRRRGDNARRQNVPPAFDNDMAGRLYFSGTIAYQPETAGAPPAIRRASSICAGRPAEAEFHERGVSAMRADARARANPRYGPGAPGVGLRAGGLKTLFVAGPPHADQCPSFWPARYQSHTREGRRAARPRPPTGGAEMLRHARRGHQTRARLAQRRLDIRPGRETQICQPRRKQPSSRR